MRRLWISLYLIATAGWAQQAIPPAPSPKAGQVVVSGMVADDASKAAILARLHELYGADKVVDQISVGSVTVPPNWNAYVQKLINPNLKLISRGQLKIDGNVVALRGEVSNEAQRQQIASEIATGLSSAYTVNNGLRVSASEQNMLDSTLANRIIEFDSGQTSLTASGKGILDEIAAVLLKMQGKKVEIIGHTDNQGLRRSNLVLSQARAESVKAYLAGKGIGTNTLTALGQGPDRPVTTNDSAEGRARNRRIEFRVSQ
jgi:OmpA-OmpF porin, OOP family